jgi:hypothetical protein
VRHKRSASVAMQRHCPNDHLELTRRGHAAASWTLPQTSSWHIGGRQRLYKPCRSWPQVEKRDRNLAEGRTRFRPLLSDHLSSSQSGDAIFFTAKVASDPTKRGRLLVGNRRKKVESPHFRPRRSRSANPRLIIEPFGCTPPKGEQQRLSTYERRPPASPQTARGPWSGGRSPWGTGTCCRPRTNGTCQASRRRCRRRCC